MTFVDLQTAFTAETRLAEGEWLKEQLNVVNFLIIIITVIII
jgi:hypothetical protein